MAPSATSTNNGGSGRVQFDTFSNVIDGKLVNSSKTRHGINPATKKANPEVPIATSQDVDDTVAAARKAFKSWAKTTVEERKKALNDYANEFLSYKEEFSKLLTMEQGKPVCYSMGNNIFRANRCHCSWQWLQRKSIRVMRG